MRKAKAQKVISDPCHKCGGIEYILGAGNPSCIRCRYLRNEKLRNRRRIKKPLTVAMTRLGLSYEDVERLKTYYDGKCAICGGTDRLVIDHCHTTVAFRGILCNGCNLGLGHFRDNPVFLQRAISYLMQNSTTL